ncbi:MAG: hypothetical protein LBT59_03650, partial [Clostridiales bacterium]|nr:hypothetical protein [Clostridiales bacterium]
AYMGGAQDEYGYEDEESKLAFAGVTKEEIGRLNPWARIASKENPPTGDGILLMLGLLAAFAIQLVLSLKLMAKAKKKI